MTNKKIIKAVLPVAGLGTRFLPATKAIPKEMLNIVDKPCIQYIVEEAVESGITDIILVTSNLKRSIEDHFDYSYQLKTELEKSGKHAELDVLEKIEKMANFIFVRQDRPLGDGHAILCAKEIIKDEAFAVLFGDDIYDSNPPALKQLIEAYEELNAPIIGLHEVPKEDTYKYGIVSGTPQESSLDNLFLLNGLVEKPRVEQAPSNMSIVGKYIITPELLHTLINTRKEENKDLRLADAMAHFIKENRLYGRILKGQRFDTGDKLGFLKATIHYAKKHESLGESVKELLGQ